MNYLEYFQRLSIPEQRYELLRFAKLAKAKRLTTENVVSLLDIAKNERYYDYADLVSKILTISGPFRKVVLFQKLLEVYFSKSTEFEMDLKNAFRTLIIKEITSGNPILLQQYKRVLEVKGVKAGLIADFMAKRGIFLKDYDFKNRRKVLRATDSFASGANPTNRSIGFKIRRELLP